MKTAKDLELSLLLKESHIIQLNLYISELENRIDKAIEFINYYTIEHTFEDFKSMSLNDDELTELLEILKGDSNE